MLLMGCRAKYAVPEIKGYTDKIEYENRYWFPQTDKIRLEAFCCSRTFSDTSGRLFEYDGRDGIMLKGWYKERFNCYAAGVSHPIDIYADPQIRGQFEDLKYVAVYGKVLRRDPERPGIDTEKIEIVTTGLLSKLINALGPRDSHMRRLAAYVLGGIGAEAAAAVPELANALGDPNPATRRSVAEVLGKIGPGAGNAVPALIGALSDTDPAVRSTVIETLGCIGPNAAGAVPELSRMSRSEEGLRPEVFKALERMGAAGVLELNKINAEIAAKKAREEAIARKQEAKKKKEEARIARELERRQAEFIGCLKRKQCSNTRYVGYIEYRGLLLRYNVLIVDSKIELILMTAKNIGSAEAFNAAAFFPLMRYREPHGRGAPQNYAVLLADQSPMVRDTGNHMRYVLLPNKSTEFVLTYKLMKYFYAYGDPPGPEFVVKDFLANQYIYFGVVLDDIKIDLPLSLSKY